MSTVYITHEPQVDKHGWVPDFSPASQYGKLVYVFESSQKPFQNAHEALLQARRRLADFDSQQDFVLWPNTGDPAALWACIHAILGMGFDEITYLYWNRHRDENKKRTGKGFYTPYRMDT